MVPVTPKALALSALFVALLVVVAMALGASFERAVFLAPVLLVVAAGIAFLVVLWTKVIRDSLRGRG